GGEVRVQRTRAAAERRRVHTRGLVARFGGAAEEAVRRRRLVGAEGPIRDRTGRVALRVTEGDGGEVAAHVAAGGHLQARAEHDDRHQARAQVRVRVDLVLHQADDEAGAL